MVNVNIRWLELLDPREQAHSLHLPDWWNERYGMYELLGSKPGPDFLEKVVLNSAVLALLVALRLTLKKLLRGEATIPFGAARTAATGLLLRDLVEVYWLQLGKDRGMRDPLFSRARLMPGVATRISHLPRWSIIQRLLDKIDRALLSRPKAASAFVAMPTANAAAETGAPLPAPIPEPGAPQQPPPAQEDHSAETPPPPSDVSDVPPPEPLAKGRKRGPSPDYQTAARVAAIVAPFRPQWRRPSERLDLVLQALEEGAGDQEKIPIPKKWGKHGIYNWTDAGLNAQTRSLAKKAIQHHLDLADQERKL